MPMSDFERGWYAGAQSLTRWLADGFRSRRKGTIPSMDAIRFDSLVEKHLDQVEPKDDRHPADNRDKPPARPYRDGKSIRCPGCKGILSNHPPAACPDCRQPLDREPR